MNEPTLVLDLIPKVLPDQFIKKLEQISNSEDEKTRYSLIFRGFEEFQLMQYIVPPYEFHYKLHFNDTLNDLLACIRCDGTCQTRVTRDGVPMYYGLHYQDIKFGGGKPAFRVFMCPGVNVRKEQIKKMLLSKQPE